MTNRPARSRRRNQFYERSNYKSFTGFQDPRLVANKPVNRYPDHVAITAEELQEVRQRLADRNAEVEEAAAQTRHISEELGQTVVGQVMPAPEAIVEPTVTEQPTQHIACLDNTP